MKLSNVGCTGGGGAPCGHLRRSTPRPRGSCASDRGPPRSDVHRAIRSCGGGLADIRRRCWRPCNSQSGTIIVPSTCPVKPVRMQLQSALPFVSSAKDRNPRRGGCNSCAAASAVARQMGGELSIREPQRAGLRSRLKELGASKEQIRDYIARLTRQKSSQRDRSTAGRADQNIWLSTRALPRCTWTCSTRAVKVN